MYESAYGIVEQADSFARKYILVRYGIVEQQGYGMKRQNRYVCTYGMERRTSTYVRTYGMV